jgi:hypothetical protein
MKLGGNYEEGYDSSTLRRNITFSHLHTASLPFFVMKYIHHLISAITDRHLSTHSSFVHSFIHSSFNQYVNHEDIF